MKFIVGGGVGEHGRNCFYISGNVNYIVDCGIMRGANQPYPNITTEQIRTAKYLFLTHPHEDHIGAFSWLVENGFSGIVIGAPETLSKISDYPHKYPLQRNKRDYAFGDIGFSYGRSGHCVGSVWYIVETDSKVFFSGDYSENSCYCVDRVCGKFSDLAVIDCAFGNSDYDANTQLKKIISYVKENSSKNILLPVPQNGRAVDILSAFNNWGLSICLDKKSKNFIADYGNDGFWLNQNACKLNCYTVEKTDGTACVYLVADAQLSEPENVGLAERIINQGGKVLITGHTDTGGKSDSLLRKGLADKIPFNAHCCKTDVDRIVGRNSFKKVICYHTESFQLKEQL